MPTLPRPLGTAAWLRHHATHRPLRVVDLRCPGLLFEGSWSDWSSDPARPAATGPNPMGEPA